MDNIPAITQGLLCSTEEYKSLLLSDDLPEKYPDSSTFLIVYAIYSRLTRITCYPVTMQSLWKLSLIMTSSDPDIMQKIITQLNPSEVIHTTGLKKKNDEFVVENYITPQQSWEKAQTIIHSLKKISQVKACSIELVSKK